MVICSTDLLRKINGGFEAEHSCAHLSPFHLPATCSRLVGSITVCLSLGVINGTAGRVRIAVNHSCDLSFSPKNSPIPPFLFYIYFTSFTMYVLLLSCFYALTYNEYWWGSPWATVIYIWIVIPCYRDFLLGACSWIKSSRDYSTFLSSLVVWDVWSSTARPSNTFCSIGVWV